LSTVAGTVLLLHMVQGQLKADPWTFRVVLPVTPPWTPDMVVLPPVRAVARPLVLIVATDVFDEPQVTWEEMFCVLPP
jgi:hypothetical protein